MLQRYYIFRYKSTKGKAFQKYMITMDPCIFAEKMK